MTSSGRSLDDKEQHCDVEDDNGDGQHRQTCDPHPPRPAVHERARVTWRMVLTTCTTSRKSLRSTVPRG